MLSKVCTRCGETKPETHDFWGSTPSGNFRGYCNDCMNKASREYEAKNKDKRRARDAKRAEAGGGSRRSFDVATKRALFEKQNGQCPGCFKPIDRPEIGEVDHVVPLSISRREDASNLLLMHARCNRDKHKKTLSEYWNWRVKVGMDDENLGRKHGLIP
jgi:5-methylcytosine-specific restriction endonuclease McrA